MIKWHLSGTNDVLDGLAVFLLLHTVIMVAAQVEQETELPTHDSCIYLFFQNLIAQLGRIHKDGWGHVRLTHVAGGRPRRKERAKS
ncbi:hypothetical protein HAX54_010308, partial [Datura stramonium]|nr:hypothetical protein [Datura stramonium]